MRRSSLYQDLGDRLRRDIAAQRYANRRLPTEAELSAKYGVSRQTVRRALQDLVAEGAIYRVPGRGTFAFPVVGKYLRSFGSIDDLLALSLDTDMEIIKPLAQVIDIDAAGRLQAPDDRVYSLTLRRRHDGQPFCVTNVFLPMAIGSALRGQRELTVADAVSRATVIGLIQTRIRRRIVVAHQSISAVAASGVSASALSCDIGKPLLRIDRVYWDADDNVVELAVSHFDPSRYTYRLELRRGSTGP